MNGLVKNQALLFLIVVVSCVLSSAGASENGTSQDAGPENIYTVVVSGFDPEWKIQAIKSVRKVTGLGLADAKNLLERAPSVLKSGLHLPEAEAIMLELEKSRLEVTIMAEQ